MAKQSGSNTNRKRPWIIAGLVVTSFLCAVFLYSLFPSIFEVWQNRTNDSLMRFNYKVHGKAKIFPLLAHVDITDSDMFTAIPNIWDRSPYEKIIRILQKANVHSVVFDVVFLGTHSSVTDEAMTEATRESGNIYFPVIASPSADGQTSKRGNDQFIRQHLLHPKIIQDGQPISTDKTLTVFPELLKAARGIGHIICYPDIDGVYRRIPLLIRCNDGYIPTLSLMAACEFLHIDPNQTEVHFGREIILRNADFGQRGKKDIHIPIDDQGQMRIPFAGPWDNSFSHYTFQKILPALSDSRIMDDLRDEIEKNIIIVSDITTYGRDVGPVPLEINYPLSGLHMNIINAILTERFIIEARPFVNMGITIICVLLITYAAICFNGFWFSVIGSLLLVLFIVMYIGLYLFHDILIQVIYPSLGFLFALLTVNTYQYADEQQQKAILRSKFASYFAPPLLDKIVKEPDILQTSEKKELTVLFSDISGFTSWCTTKPPEEIKFTLNEYFDEMTKIVFSNEGTIDKFMGDGLMVFFGDPVDQPEHTLQAVRTAIAMQKKAREIRHRWETEDRLPLQIRIGIHTGEMVVGNMGSENRMDYTVIGSNVNLAQRMEANAPIGGILVSEAVYNKVKSYVRTEYYGLVQAKGISEQLKTYTIPLEETNLQG
jgi:adenylate cyclase